MFYTSIVVMYRGRPQQTSGSVSGVGQAGYQAQAPGPVPMNGHYPSTGSLGQYGGYAGGMNDGPRQSQSDRDGGGAPHFDVRYGSSSSSLNAPNVSSHILSSTGSPGPASPKSPLLLGRLEGGPVDFESLRQDCLRKNVLYEDPYFPANDKSLYYSRYPPYKFEWLRPAEIVRYLGHGLKPELFVGGASRFDLNQGKLGDCWVVAALASISENMDLVFNVVPKGQSFRPEWYAGMFKFRFFQYGKWTEVIIDDKLPTFRGKLVFINSNTPNEFWGALVEKAYAKLCGSYEALKGGHVADALTDFTGGMTETYQLRSNRVPRNIVNIMFKALERQSVIGAGIQSPDEKSAGTEVVLANGLASGHAYSITDMREIRLISDRGEIPITLVRVRNPWGSRIEWNGPWSDRSPEWNSIPEQDRRMMGLVFRDDGEFWMDFRDFLDNFTSLDICNLSPETNTMAMKQWIPNAYHSRWVEGYSAGGRPSCRDTHWTNPQFKVTLRESDDDEDNMCSLLVEVTQKDRRKIKMKQAPYLSLGFALYKVVRDFNVPLPKKYFQHFDYVEACDAFVDSRQTTKRFLMAPGEYVIVPCTYDRDEQGDFMLRIFFEKDNQAELADDTIEIGELPAPSPDPDFRRREEEFKRFFYETAGEDMDVNAYELHRILNEALKSDPNHREIGIDACKSMLVMMDVDQSGRLGYTEFIYLWNIIKSWKKTFYASDKDRSGSIDSIELRSSIADLGYKLNSRLMQSLIFRYSDASGRIDLDNFIICLSKLMHLFNVYQSKKQSNPGHFTLDEWLMHGIMI